MKNQQSILFIFLLISFKMITAQNITYPVTKKVDQSDIYFGKKVEDPYRWLEDDKSTETAEWVKKQNLVTESYLSQIPYREKIKTRLTELWDFPKYSPPFSKGKNWFFFENTGKQNQNVLYVSTSAEGKDKKVVFDPNDYDKDGTTSVNSLGISKDGNTAAIGLSKAGSDWIEIILIDIKTQKKLVDDIKWVKFSNIAWYKNGFYYSRYDEPIAGKEFSNKNEFHKIYYHKIGEPQAKDKLIYENKLFAQRNYSAMVSDDEKFLVILSSITSSKSTFFFKDLSVPNAPWIEPITDKEQADYDFVGVHNNRLFFTTNLQAPNRKIVEVDPKIPALTSWRTIVPESVNTIEGAHIINNKLVVQSMENVASVLKIYTFEGTVEYQIPVEHFCSIDALTGGKTDTVFYYSSVSFTKPASVYKYSFATKNSSIFKAPEISFNSNDYETKQVFYRSIDGTKVSMFITHKKGLKLDGNNPTFLFGYGGFNISYKPEFRIDRAVFLENGGVYAVANLRGGGEYGEKWHEAGTKLNKQNVFDDFIAAAEYLTANNYTNSAKLAIHGRSNGGLLVGAVMTQRPDLAKVAIPTVGVLDMLRYHKFTIGWAWAGDYGTSEDEKNFKNLFSYSPLHNVKKVKYPATLVTTADHDDRVVPAHSFKFISTLQEKNVGDNPMLIRIDSNAGHGSGKPVNKQIEEFADMWSFVFYNLEITIN